MYLFIYCLFLFPCRLHESWNVPAVLDTSQIIQYLLTDLYVYLEIRKAALKEKVIEICLIYHLSFCLFVFGCSSKQISAQLISFDSY